jgi:hypothetical protein
VTGEQGGGGFISPESIAAAGDKRQLRVVVDVSCDTTNPNNPILGCGTG